MADILLGLLAIVAGAAMLVAGQFVLRFIIPIWGFFAGFAFGAGLVAELADEHFLGTVLGWVLGLVFALVFAVLAYLYYYVAVVLAMGAAGFAIGSGLVVALGISWNWVAVLVGLVVGLVVGIGCVIVDMPMVVLVIIGAIAGAVSVTAGLMLLVGDLNTRDFTRGDFTDTVSDSAWWSLLLLVLAVIGIVIGARQRAVMRQSVREVWYAELTLAAPDHPPLGLVDRLLELRAGLEGRGRRRGDVDGLAGLRVAALARGPVPGLERPEARQRHLLAGGQGGGDRVEDRVQGPVGLGGAEVGRLGHRVPKLGLVHVRSLWRWSVD